MRKTRDLKQAMILQSEMLHQKDFVACKLKQVAVENYELKLQNARLWTLVERQKQAFLTAQEELDMEREEQECMLEELITENKSLRDILKISDQFNSASFHELVTESLRQAETQIGNGLKNFEPRTEPTVVDLKKMVAEASGQIKELAQQRKLERQRQQEEMTLSDSESSSLPVNGKRSIQPKKAFLLAEGANTSDSDEDEVDADESDEERKARKEAARKRREQQLLLDQMDGVPLNSNKKITIFNLDSAF